MDVILKYILMIRDVRMWTAFVWLTKGLVRGLVFTEMELRISMYNISIEEVDTEV
jgi:hypothetical protein